jgi:hypothetical protein
MRLHNCMMNYRALQCRLGSAGAHAHADARTLSRKESLRIAPNRTKTPSNHCTSGETMRQHTCRIPNRALRCRTGPRGAGQRSFHRRCHHQRRTPVILRIRRYQDFSGAIKFGYYITKSGGTISVNLTGGSQREEMRTSHTATPAQRAAGGLYPSIILRPRRHLRTPNCSLWAMASIFLIFVWCISASLVNIK